MTFYMFKYTGLAMCSITNVQCSSSVNLLCNIINYAIQHACIYCCSPEEIVFSGVYEMNAVCTLYSL